MSPVESSNPHNEATTGAGLGTLLRAARERLGLSQVELGNRLKLPAATIDALEREDLAALPGPVYVRGYLRRLATELGLDETELQQAHDRIAGESAPIMLRPSPRTEPMRMPREKRRLHLLLGMAIMGVVLVTAGFLAQRYLPANWLETDDATPPAAASPAASTPALTVPLESVPLPPSQPPAEGPAPGTESPAASPTGASEGGHAAEPPAPAAETGTPPSSAPAAAPVGPAPTAGQTQPSASLAAVLELRTSTSASWVQVKDANGKVLIEEVLRPGTTRKVQGQRPLQIRIGNAAATSLMLDGQAVDLSPYTRPSGTAFIANLGG